MTDKFGAAMTVVKSDIGGNISVIYKTYFLIYLLLCTGLNFLTLMKYKHAWIFCDRWKIFYFWS